MEFWAKVKAVFRRRRLERDLENEVAFHLAMLEEKNREKGIARQEAQYAARRQFGNVTRMEEKCRELWRFTLLENFWTDLQYGARMLRKNPGFTAVAVLAIALGIGANTAIFSLVNGVLLSSIPVRDPENLKLLQWNAKGEPSGGYSSFGDCDEHSRTAHLKGCSFTYPMFRNMRSKTVLFSSVGAFAGPRQVSASGNGPAGIATVEMVSGDYFETLGVLPALGRTLQQADEASGAEPTIVLSYAYWKTAFGGAVSAVGKTIRLNGAPFIIVGVADPRFTRLTPGRSCDMWMSLTQIPLLGADWGRDLPEAPNRSWLLVAARLRPSVSVAQAEAALSSLYRSVALYGAKPMFKEKDEPNISVVPAQKGLTGFRTQLATPLYLLMVAVGVVLLITCANVAGLLLSRAAAREREMAVRLALGAGRARIVRQLLTESLLLSGAGAMLGLLFAFWGADALGAMMSANFLGHLSFEVHPDARVLVFTAIVALVTGILFGLAPAFRGTRVDVTPTLKESAGASGSSVLASRRRWRLGRFLVVAQVALSVLVLVAAGLFLRTLVNLKGINPGFDTHNVLTFGMTPSQVGYDDQRARALYNSLQERLAALPGVISASYASDVLLTGSNWWNDIYIQGSAANDKSGLDKSGLNKVNVAFFGAGPGFFETMRFRLLEGRTFTARDLTPTPSVTVVNETFVKQFIPGANVIGMHLCRDGECRERREIIGVVADTKYDALTKSTEPLVFLPERGGQAYFTLRTTGDPAAVISAVRRVVSDLDSNLPLFAMRTQSEAIDQSLADERLVARLSMLFGCLAIALASIGLYGLLSYEVTRRTRELGIRSALGAQQREMLRLVVGQGFVLALLGGVIGVGLALGLTRFVRSQLYGVAPNDPLTYSAVVLLLLVVAVLACAIPARRATKVDPVVALRYE
jgi:predicted permease